MDSQRPEVCKIETLEEVQIHTLPSVAYYIADFLTVEEEELLLRKIETAPRPRWTQLKNRRLQVWPSDLAKGDTLLEAPLPQWLIDPVIPRLLSLPVSKAESTRNIFADSPHKAPNHVLINEYLPGQGIMPHKDGPAYYPVVCTVSLGAKLCLDLYGSKEDGATEASPRWRVLQEPRSLLITSSDLYENYLHGIAEIKHDVDLGPTTVANWDLLSSPDAIIDGHNERQTRTSLTYRDVLKVAKLNTKLGIFGRR
ncbi:alkylated DNA repair protein-like protein alkB 6 [Xylogone sp. PMI_703]|nr:alkylated DNA repair protein-like protein alkB 6 [Xylogone sp. PMI_703]